MWPVHKCDDLQTEEIRKPLYSSLAEEPEDSNRWRWEKKDNSSKSKIFIEVNGSDHFNMIFNRLIKNAEQMKLKNQKQSDIRSFLRS